MATRSFFLERTQLRKSDRLVLFQENRVIVKDDNFLWQQNQVIDRLPDDSEFLLVDHNNEQFVVVTTSADIASEFTAESRSLRSLLFKESDIDFSVAGKASQILSWYQSHRFCGVCGGKTIRHNEHRAVYCGECNEHFFPRINPCAIMLVTKGREILLARSARFKSGFFSCLAGFIEVGESAEDTVHREVKEEAGVEIENIRYVKSQSWPFPSQLMLGFHADYKSGEIVPEPGEIEEAAFYDVDNLPTVPSPEISVAGELIKLYVEQVNRGEF